MRGYRFPTEDDGPVTWPDPFGDDGDGDGYDQPGTRAGSGAHDHQGGRRS